MKRLLVTGDDFGLAPEVNQAIEAAHREGILKTASLMVTGAAAADAVERARRMPELGVGLHLVLVEGRPALPAREVPALVDENGDFLEQFVRAGFRFFFSPRARRQLAREIRAQFEAFRATGLQLDHVNTHNHMHLHPTILGLLLEIGRDFGMKAVRLPRAVPARKAKGTSAAPKASQRLGDVGLSPMVRWVRRRLVREGIVFNDHVLGLHETGFMDETTVLRLLESLPDGTNEMYFHPATGHCAEIERVSPGTSYNAEFEALRSTRVRDRLRSLGVAPMRFADLSSHPDPGD